MARWALDGLLDLDGMVSRELGLHEVDEAFRAMLACEVIRSVVVFDA
jgi:Zn-dependent alcohol dehydrogenase